MAADRDPSPAATPPARRRGLSAARPPAHRALALALALALAGACAVLAAGAAAAQAPRGRDEARQIERAEQSSRDLREQTGQRAQWCQQNPQNCVANNHLRYAEVLRDAILAQWRPPASVAAEATCILDLRQAPGGRVTSAQAVEPCGFDAAGRDSIVAAALKAQPLPYAGYEQVFRPQLRLQVRAADPADEEPPKRGWRRLKERLEQARDR